MWTGKKRQGIKLLCFLLSSFFFFLLGQQWKLIWSIYSSNETIEQNLATKAWKWIQRFIILQGSYLAAVNLLLTTVIKISRTWNLLLPKRQLFVSVGSFLRCYFLKKQPLFQKDSIFYYTKTSFDKNRTGTFPCILKKRKKHGKMWNCFFFVPMFLGSVFPPGVILTSWGCLVISRNIFVCHN